MTYLFAQPATVKFSWELEVALTNILSLDPTASIQLVFLESDAQVIEYLSQEFPQAAIAHYPDERQNTSYPADIRPYLLWKFFADHPEKESEVYFQLDSDVIFRELPDFSKLSTEGKVCWASDCGGYIDYQYLITRKNGEDVVQTIASTLGVDGEVIKKTAGGGAQWLFSGHTVSLWEDIYQCSQPLHARLLMIDSDVQSWTGEMWSQLYLMVKHGWQIKLSDELDFCRPTDNIMMWDRVKILHNAGVTGIDAAALFFKDEYTTRHPFHDDLSWVRRDKASSKYVEAIRKVQ